MFIGHKKQLKFLKNAFQEKRLSHAYLFSGPEGVGKKTFALELVNFKRTHPDFFLVEPELDKKEIQISQIRDLIYKLSLKPFLSSYKTAIIDRADLMNSQAQNCLLKTLEEPKGNTLLILIAEHPEVLFETIRSRVQEVKFFPVPKNEIRNFLRAKGASQERIEEIANLSLGRPGKALEFLKDSEKIEKEKKQVLEFSKALNSDIGVRFQYAHSLAKKPLKEIFEVWLRYFRQMLLLKTGVREENSFLINFPNFSLAKIKKIIEHLERMNYLISTKNINRRLALETLMLNI